MECDVVVLGAGVLGLSLAYHLSQSGARVIVLEREALPGLHASGKNAGMLRKLYHHPQLTKWAHSSTLLWPEELRVRCFRLTGSLIVGREVPTHEQKLFTQRSIGNPLDPRIELPAVFTASDGLLDSPNYLNGMYRLARAQGARIHFRLTLTQAERRNGNWQLRTSSGDEIRCAFLVNSTGAWLEPSLQSCMPDLKIAARPFARHLFLIHGFPIGYMPQPACGFYWDEANGWYLREWDENSRLVSICDRISVTPENFMPDPELPLRVSNLLLSMLPEVSSGLSILRSWHCFRTYTEDQLPVIGFDPVMPQLYWLGAFGGLGMSTSFAASKDAASEILGQERTVPLEFSPSRTRLIAGTPLLANA